MKKLIISFIVLGGAYYIWRRFQKVDLENEEDLNDESDDYIVVTDSTDNSSKSTSEVVVKDILNNSEHRTDSVDYSDYYISNGSTIDDIMSEKKNYDKERRRRNYQEQHEEGRMKPAGSPPRNKAVGKYSPYTHYLLRSISTYGDPELYIVMAYLIEGMKLGDGELQSFPTMSQDKFERSIFDEMRRRAEEYYQEDYGTYKEYYGSVGEVLLYLAGIIVRGVDLSYAGVLDLFLKNGGFYDGIIRDGENYIIDHEKIYEASYKFLISDHKNTDVIIFGTHIYDKIKEYPVEPCADRSWLNQADLYIDMLSGIQ